jgi:hypothetical protein
MPGNIYSSSIDWSPDGRWLVARNQNRNRLELINPAPATSSRYRIRTTFGARPESRDIRLSAGSPPRRGSAGLYAARAVLAERCRRTNKSLAIPGGGVG